MPPAAPAAGAPVLPGQPVTWGTRMASGLIDYIAIPLPIYAVGWLAALILPGETFWLSIAGLAALGVVVWNMWTQGETGQSIGKKYVGTRVVDMQGRTIGGGMGILRWLLHILDALPCYVGYLWPLWDTPKRQTFSDKIVSTVVIPA